MDQEMGGRINVPICATVFLCFASLTQCSFYKQITTENYALLDHKYRQVTDVTLFQCKKFCKSERKCISVNFQGSLESKGCCALNGCGVEDEEKLQKSLVFTPGCYYHQLRPTAAAIAEGGKYSKCSVKPKFPDCASLRKSGVTTSGIYSVYPDGKGPMDVYCDMVTDVGGWTVIQRRKDGSVDFYLDWPSYKQGFGNLSGEFWLGNDNIHRLTASGEHVLRVELEDWDGNTAFAVYGRFGVADESDRYKLTVGSYNGTAGDSLGYYSGMMFTTRDRDNDLHSQNCAHLYEGAWWYRECSWSNLNGLYLGNIENFRGVTWHGWKTRWLSMKGSQMKTRSSSYLPST